jgi:activator of 2-hydroxyglutaryl-CoA dehydratase
MGTPRSLHGPPPADRRHIEELIELCKRVTARPFQVDRRGDPVMHVTGVDIGSTQTKGYSVGD